MTTPAPTPQRPEDPQAAALYDAVATEHATIYGYGLVSAHASPGLNSLVSEAMAEHRDQREAAMALLESMAVTPPLPAPGYRLPLEVDEPAQAAKLAIQMEDDTAVAWRAVLEQATPGTPGDDARRLAVPALTTSAVLGARWKRVAKMWPVTQAFPGGAD